MFKINYRKSWLYPSRRQCRREASETLLQKILCWLMGCCPEETKSAKEKTP